MDGKIDGSDPPPPPPPSEGIVEGALGDDKDFARTVREAFETLLNAPGEATRPAAALVAYTDELFRSGFRDAGDAGADEALTQVLILFRLLADKDQFEERYKAALQRRLLGGRVGVEDYERLMIAKLKHECGFQFTSKLEGMFNDWRASSELCDAYR
jgi:cullin 3